jgi:hypothetical protein
VTDTDLDQERLESDEAAALQNLLREASTVAAGSTIRPPTPLIEADLGRGRAAARRRRARRRAGAGLVAVTSVAAAAAVVVAAAQPAQHPSRPGPLSGPAHGTAPVMHLAAYSLRLPSSYLLTAATTSDCPALGVTYSRPASTASGSGHTGARPATTASRADVPQYAPLVATQAHAEGGCIVMALAPPYTPTAADPDPETAGLVGAQAVQVGHYEGRAGTSTLYAKPSDARSTLEWLYVEIPLADGQHQDLVVSGYRLSRSALISLVANGLTAAAK